MKCDRSDFTTMAPSAATKDEELQTYVQTMSGKMCFGRVFGLELNNIDKSLGIVRLFWLPIACEGTCPNKCLFPSGGRPVSRLLSEKQITPSDATPDLQRRKQSDLDLKHATANLRPQCLRKHDSGRVDGCGWYGPQIWLSQNAWEKRLNCEHQSKHGLFPRTAR